jgi:hypothetical protein
VRATSGENLRIERLRVTGAVDYGIYVERNPFERASLKMEHVLVEGTSQTDENGGAGLTLVGSSDVQVSSFAMENNTRVGIWIPPPGRAIQMIHLSRGRVRGSRTGIFADVEAHVPWQILDGVQLSENGESLSK